MSKSPTSPLVTVERDTSPIDAEWDAFLESHPDSPFQQTSMWGAFKAKEGWGLIRYKFRMGELIGGFQLLVRKTRFGNAAFVPQGPVFPVTTGFDDHLVTTTLKRAARENRLKIMLVRLPDRKSGKLAPLIAEGFRPYRSINLPQANLILPVLRNSVCDNKKIRQAKKRGVLVTEGTKDDLAAFFELMTSSCRRQGAGRPNPASPERLHDLWDCFERRQCIRLTFAEHDGIRLAGMLSIRSGSRLTFWKKGWSGDGAYFRPNEMLVSEGIEWAGRNGISECDFAGLDEETARSLEDGVPLTDAQRHGRDYFNIQLGGVPVLTPPPLYFVDSVLLRPIGKWIAERFA